MGETMTSDALPEETTDDGGSIACPWCKEDFADLWDYSWGNRESIEVECPHGCGGTFLLCREVTVDYTARPLAKVPA